MFRVTGPLPIFASYYAFVIVSLTWLADVLSHDYLSYINSLGFFLYFLFLSDEGPMLETLEYTIRIGSRPTFYIWIRNDKRTEHWRQAVHKKECVAAV